MIILLYIITNYEDQLDRNVQTVGRRQRTAWRVLEGFPGPIQNYQNIPTWKNYKLGQVVTSPPLSRRETVLRSKQFLCTSSGSVKWRQESQH